MLSGAEIWREEKGLYHRVQRLMLCTDIAVVLWFCYFLSGNVWMSWCEHHCLVCRLQFLQCFYSFILLLSHLVFSPSLSCTHVRPGSVGVWRMTHLLHTSSLLGHIWAARKSICVVERSRQCRDNMMSSFLLSLFFCAIFQNEDL